MLYLADLHRDGLVKVGITRERRERARQSELRRQLREPRLELFFDATVPQGWGSDREWERRLLRNIRVRSNRLQIFAAAHVSTEGVEATRDETCTELLSMLRATEVDPNYRATELDASREDWRFEGFMHLVYPECRESSARYWRDSITRQAFLYWLRGEPIARWERLSRGFSCAEIDEILERP